MIKQNNKIYDLKTILKSLRILYIEDEKVIRENIEKTLNLLCKETISFSNSEDALIYLDKKCHIDIIISDINLSKMSGLEFIKRVREQNEYIPIIIISAYMEHAYLLDAIKLRIIDYLTKPINFKTLNEALLKSAQEIVKLGKYTIFFNNDTCYNLQNKRLCTNIDNKEVLLTSKEITLLEYLLENSQRVISHDEIKNQIWEDSFEATDSALKNLLNKLRKKIGKDSIKNISGVGYKIEVI